MLRAALGCKGAKATNAFLHLDAPHLWNGVKDPYLYTCVVRLLQDGKPVDEVTTKVGLRSFSVDAKEGLFPQRQALSPSRCVPPSGPQGSGQRHHPRDAR